MELLCLDLLCLLVTNLKPCTVNDFDCPTGAAASVLLLRVPQPTYNSVALVVESSKLKCRTSEPCKKKRTRYVADPHQVLFHSITNSIISYAKTCYASCTCK